MKHQTTSVVAILAVLQLSFASVHANAQGFLTVKTSLQDAKTGQIVKQENSAYMPAVDGSRVDGIYTSNDGIRQTLMALHMADAIKNSLVDYDKVGENNEPWEPLDPVLDLNGEIHVEILPAGDDEVVLKRKAVAATFLTNVLEIEREVFLNTAHVSDEKILDAIELMKKLAKNMEEAKDNAVHMEGIGIAKIGGIAAPAAAAGGFLNVTGGGAKGMGYVRKLIEDGRVPNPSAFAPEGFLSELNLAMPGLACDELICVHPVVAVDGNKQKLFVQVAMNSNVTPESFARKPLNLSVVIDVSGSMSATDQTEKNRLEWAKDAAIKAIDQLSDEDMFSLVIFDSESEILIRPRLATNKDELRTVVNALVTKGSTNVYAGLKDGFELVSQNVADHYENRVILISDAGLNTGEQDPAELLRLISDYASEKIGLTAIGLGENFKQPLIHQITMSQGGNYVYVHSGKEMFNFFKNFKYLVTPVAYNFKVNTQFTGMSAKFVKAYGVPMKDGETLGDIMNVRTLFFSEQGGAIVLEYDLQ